MKAWAFLALTCLGCFSPRAIPAKKLAGNKFPWSAVQHTLEKLVYSDTPAPKKSEKETLENLVFSTDAALAGDEEQHSSSDVSTDLEASTVSLARLESKPAPSAQLRSSHHSSLSAAALDGEDAQKEQDSLASKHASMAKAHSAKTSKAESAEASKHANTAKAQFAKTSKHAARAKTEAAEASTHAAAAKREWAEANKHNDASRAEMAQVNKDVKSARKRHAAIAHAESRVANKHIALAKAESAEATKHAEAAKAESTLANMHSEIAKTESVSADKHATAAKVAQSAEVSKSPTAAGSKSTKKVNRAMNSNKVLNHASEHAAAAKAGDSGNFAGLAEGSVSLARKHDEVTETEPVGAAQANQQADKDSDEGNTNRVQASPKIAQAVQLARSRVAGRSSSWCPGNRFPDLNITVEGKGQYDDVINASVLQSVLAADPEWGLLSPWTLSLTASSLEDADRSFGFAGGRGHDKKTKGEGFLEFAVPARTLDKKISVSGTVKSLASHTWFEYRGAEVITRPGAIKFTNICLVPAKCDRYFATNPSMCTGGVWERLPAPENRTGHNRSTCCKEMTCQASAPCEPSTKYSRRPSYSTAKGSTAEQCCIPKLCTADVCNSTIWQPKSGQAFGSTEQECCEPLDCDLYKCSSSTKWAKNTTSGVGSTDDECCTPKNCSAFDCTASDKWATKESPGDFLGSTFDECCDPQFCVNHTCSPASKWEANPAAVQLPGSTNPTCCTPKFCKDHSCNASLQLRAGATAGTKSLQGSTDDECCETKLCKDYKCSDTSKWEHKSDQTVTNIDRRGWSDTECCEPILCASNDCLPETLWQKRNASDLEGVQGTSSDQCCKPLFCEDYTCSGDYLDINVSSTKWYKKVDTNHYKFRGSTDQECCHPKYCSQFFTSYPSKYARMQENLTTARQGSTEAECYQELKCNEYCCVDAGKKLKANAAKHLGSTDEECCE